jgi:hypothetical protein
MADAIEKRIRDQAGALTEALMVADTGDGESDAAD